MDYSGYRLNSYSLLNNIVLPYYCNSESIESGTVEPYTAVVSIESGTVEPCTAAVSKESGMVDPYTAAVTTTCADTSGLSR